MNYADAVAWLYGTQLHGIKLGLESIERLAGALLIGPQPTFIHVAGTNGKGSVCAMADAICRAAGLRTGLYTSPHLVTFRERIRLDDMMIPEADVAGGLTKIREVMRGWEHAPTFFEIVTALALAWFQRQGAQVAILETGMGGRLDATNVVTPAVSVLTPIGLDHQAWLGSTLAEIAAEKAGILKRGVPAVSAPQAPESAAVLRHAAEHVGTSLRFIEHPLDDEWRVNLAGSHQRWNAALAVEALAAAGLEVSPAAIRQGLAAVQWPGRFQRVSDRIILDGAHNPHAAAQLAKTWREEFGDAQATLVFGAMRDKDVAGVLTALRPISARVLAVPVENARACTAEELCTIARDVDPMWPATPCDSLSAALATAESQPERVLIAGSLFLIGEALAHFDSATPEHSEQ
jgi:dihydrofolate synthase / folylpolyglutamate synthase